MANTEKKVVKKAAVRKLATKKTAAQHNESAMRTELWDLWHALQNCAEIPSKKVPTNSIDKNFGFEWSEPVKDLKSQMATLLVIDRLLIKRGFRASVFDSVDCGHQYVDRKKNLLVSLSVGRLGVYVYVSST